MAELKSYLSDGANYQARATLMFLQGEGDIIESWNGQSYEAEIQIARWENCREQGYVVSLVNKLNEQINIAFFEHRNSDKICAVKWEQASINALTIDTAEFGDVYKNKHDLSHSVNYGKAYEMAKWIFKELKTHWKKSR